LDTAVRGEERGRSGLVRAFEVVCVIKNKPSSTMRSGKVRWGVLVGMMSIY